MIFSPTDLAGVLIIDIEPQTDDRGFFARLWGRDEFAERDLVSEFSHVSVSFNTRRSTLRGLHYQTPPFAETKIVRCIRGGIYDVALDLRPESPTFRRWTAVELTADNRRALYIPAGCAHGFQTLTPDAEVLYMIDKPYRPDAARGARWNDPAFGIAWPEGDRKMNARDAGYPDFEG